MASIYSELQKVESRETPNYEVRYFTLLPSEMPMIIRGKDTASRAPDRLYGCTSSGSPRE